MRTFLALDIPDSVRGEIARIQRPLEELGAEVRWVAVQSMHITLKFLGEVPERQVVEIAGTLSSLSPLFGPLEISLQEIGAFPTRTSPRVVWLGILLNEDFSRLHQEVESKLVPLGFEPEDRPFRPHLTLGRVKGKRNLNRLAAYIASQGPQARCSVFSADALHLYRSHLHPTGARYEKLKTFQFEK